MELSFPNPCRNYDEHDSRVEFWGYVSAIQVRFFITIDALKKLDKNMGSTESDYLKTFDAKRDKILKIAEKIYAHQKFGSYACELSAEDI